MTVMTTAMKMKTITYFFLFISTLALTACKGIPIGDIDNKRDETLLVNNYKVECSLYNATSSSLCLQVKIKGDDNWILITEDEIRGFNYEWGYDYELEVEIEDLEPAPQDASSKEYTFKEEIKKAPASTVTTFKLSISSAITDAYIKEVSDKSNTYKIFDDKEIECLADDCAKLDTLIANDKAMLLVFQHQNPVSGPLDLVKIDCDAPRDTFIKDCLEN